MSVNRKDIKLEDDRYEKLRWQIASHLDRESIPDAAWEILLARGHIQAALGDGAIGEGEIIELVEFAKPLVFYADLVEQTQTGVEPKDSRWVVQPPRSDGYEADRARTLAEYLELKVAANPRVLEWRRSTFGTTRTPSARGAYELVDNPEIREAASGLNDVEANQVSPSGSLDFYGSKPGQVHRVDFYEGSDLEGLRELSEELRNELFPPWTQAEAAWIIVTGKVREVPNCLVGEIDGFSNQHLTYGTINLKVEPWITGAVVLRAYQYLQALALPRRPRVLSERNLALTRFVMEQLCDILTEEFEEGEEPPRISWRRLVARWNEEHPEWAFRDERNFFRDCRLIIRALARPIDAAVLSGDPSGSSPRVSIPKADGGNSFSES
jgi:hypothetical protein